MVLKNLENRLEQFFEGFFARTFKSGLQPVEIGRRAIRHMRDERTLDVRGKPIVPNHFVIQLSEEDFERFTPVQEGLKRELQATLRESAAEDNLGFLGRVTVELESSPDVGLGTSNISSSYDEAVGDDAPIAVLQLPDGSDYPLTGAVAKLGRHPDSTIVLSDPNASRHHAEIQPDGGGYTLVDLGSTNGSKVNGEKVQRQQLEDQDEISFGAISLIYRLA